MITAPGLPPIDRLSLAQQVAQLVVVRASGHLFDHEIRYPRWEATNADLAHWVGNLGVGGVILLGGSAVEVGLRTQGLQDQAAIPLLVAADIEEGVGQRFSGATWFPPPMALEAIAQQDLPLALDQAWHLGQATAQEALAIGLNWVLAPVVDVNNNPHNPVINVRAFGQTPPLVGQLAAAFIRGTQGQAVLTTAKHFPGHGDTTVDSHLHLPQVPHTLERLHAVELPPFQQAIEAGVDAVMTAHLQVPALDAHHPATLSAPTLTGLLRQQLGFEGLVVTDALVMGAITQTYGPYEAAVQAVAAGADVVLMPADPPGVIQALAEAVRVGRLSPQRIIASVERIWRAKQKTLATVAPGPTGHAWEHVPPPPVQVTALATPPNRQLATDLLQQSMTVSGTVSVCPEAASGCNLVLVDDLVDCRFLPATAPALARPADLNYALHLVDHRGCRHLPPATLVPTLVQIFVRGNPFRGSAQRGQLVDAWIEALLQARCLAGVVVYGSPYTLEALRPRLGDVPWGFTYGQMPHAQALVLDALLAAPAAVNDRDAAFTD